MSYSLDIENKGEYLHAVVRGEKTLANVLSYFEEIYGACLLYHCSKVLIEERLDGPALDTFDIFVIVTKNYTKAKSIDLRLAFVDVHVDRDIQGLKFGENLAHIRGVNVKLFQQYNIDEMVAWLLLKDAKPL